MAATQQSFVGAVREPRYDPCAAVPCSGPLAITGFRFWAQDADC